MKGGGTSVAPIYAGVRTDVEKLLEKFLEKSTVRYNHFVTCFHELKFSLIFAGRNTENEIREFAEKILAISLSYCFPPYSYQAQVGAVYLMYALYYLQPNKYRMKIRITLPMLRSLCDLLSTLKADAHFDACYVLNRLFYDDAFLVCMYPEEHNPLTYRRFDSKDDLERATQTLRSGKSAMDELMEDNLVDQLETVHEQYAIMKSELFHGGEQLPQALSLVTAPLTHYVKSAIRDCEEKLERRFGKNKKKKDVVDESEMTPPQKLQRKEIRERAYATAPNQTRFQRRRSTKNKD